MERPDTAALAVFSPIITRRKLPVGRLTVAMSGTHKRASERGSNRVVALCAAALAAAGHYIELRRERRTLRAARGGGRAAEVDKKVDARIRSIHKHLTSCVETYEGEPKAKAAQRLLDRYLPDGLGPIVNAPYEEELVMAEHLAEALTGPERAVTADLGLSMFVEALIEVLPEYREALLLEDTVTATEVAEARNAMHLLMLRVVVAVLADHGDDVEAMRALLAPIEDQERRLTELYAARRRGQSTGDVDVGSAAAQQAAADAEAEALAAALAAEAELDAEIAAEMEADLEAELRAEARAEQARAAAEGGAADGGPADPAPVGGAEADGPAEGDPAADPASTAPTLQPIFR